MSEIDRFVGAKLRHRRLELSMSAEQLAECLGCSLDDVKSLEAGDARLGARLIMDCSHALGVQPVYFFEGLDVLRPSAAPQRETKVVDFMQHRRLCT